jgi:hypothetical protein
MTIEQLEYATTVANRFAQLQEDHDKAIRTRDALRDQILSESKLDFNSTPKLMVMNQSYLPLSLKGAEACVEFELKRIDKEMQKAQEEFEKL